MSALSSFAAKGSVISYRKENVSMGRSLRARIVSLSLRQKYKPRSDAEVIASIEALKDAPAPAYQIPESVKLSVPVREDALEDMQVFTVNETEPGQKTILYLHGGGFHANIEPAHWALINKICAKTGAKCIVPLYPLIPYATWKESFHLLTELYRTLDPDVETILMGDSSGGGLALSLELEWAKQGLKLPDKTILFSPWVDLRTDNPGITKLQKKDPFLWAPSLRIYAKYWAGDLDLTDERVSPTFGDLSVLKNISVFIGTREIFHPDVVEFCSKLKGSQLIVGRDMNHVYPLFPIPEADLALEQIVFLVQMGEPRDGDEPSDPLQTGGTQYAGTQRFLTVVIFLLIAAGFCWWKAYTAAAIVCGVSGLLGLGMYFWAKGREKAPDPTEHIGTDSNAEKQENE